jgi:DNA polymerase-3 subunit beta
MSKTETLLKAAPSPAAESPALTGERLGQVLGVFSHVIDRRTSIPALSCVRMIADGKTLEISGTDLDHELTCKLPYGGPAFETLVPHHSLAAAVSAFGTEQPGFFSSPSELIVRGAAGVFCISAYNGKDLVRSKRQPPTATLEVARENLMRSLNLCRPAISTEETRYYLMGISLKLLNGRLELAATDGHRLHLTNCPLLSVDGEMPQVILRDRAIRCLLAVHTTETDDEAVLAELTPSRGVFALGLWTLETKFIDGTYPDYNRIIPDESVGSLNFLADDFAATLKTIRRLGGQDIKRVALDPIEGCISYVDPEATCFSRPLVAEHQGEVPAAVGLNARYAEEILKTHPHSRATIGFGATAEKPMLFRFDGDDDFLAILMPMRL